MNRTYQKQRGASLLEYAILAALIAIISTAAVMYLGKQTKRPSCLVIGAFSNPKDYGTDLAATRWKDDTQECEKRGTMGGYTVIF